MIFIKYDKVELKYTCHTLYDQYSADHAYYINLNFSLEKLYNSPMNRNLYYQ
jgi:hypothetical protein